ncbi:MAG: hypothetical protein HZA46_18695 [Planctomycetales bacterium]|nr:hypothetical protein [Planctomycetales bacterium]
MNIRWVLGGVAALAFLVGSYLGGILPGIGPGQGFSRNSVDTDSPRDSNRTAVTPPPESDIAGAVGEASQMLLVHVDGRSYLIGDLTEDKTVRRESSLDEIVELAKQRPGSDDGIRVRITRSKSSKATAEIALRDELLKAGLKAEEIVWENGPPP